MNEETLNSWIAQYESNKTLPNKKVPCTSEGCETETTAFGTNLVNKVEKANNIRAFLTNFKCRSCRKASKETKTSTQVAREFHRVAVTSIPESEVSTEEMMSVFSE